MESLNPTQREILTALIQLYEKKRDLVKSKEIGELINRDEGTVRNIMPALRAMGLVEAIAGPKGGYMPARKAYEILGLPPMVTRKTRAVPVYNAEGSKLDLIVTDIVFKDVFNEEICLVLLKAIGNISAIETGSIIYVGPTPAGRLMIEGKVIGRDELHGELLIGVVTMVSIPKEPIKNIASRKLVTVSPDLSVREAAKLLYREGIRAAPIVKDGEVLGLITTSDIARLYVEGMYNLSVMDAASRVPAVIDANADILDAMEKMETERIGRLLVMENGKPIGMVTRTDILLRLLKPFKILRQPSIKA
ncbi:MAG: histidine kinase [Candidatus Methanomethylicota archaeon]|uniref:Histidine kinase n=1 Tax=Thermoproteota archaeon TaxID=2056631 RepID=A0A497EPY0_9CREN|nr:MAG: histidine kinase [Candidatus Verstraetearchaeota archaeon]RLE50955.1 MAG: histidine kinase [Candidatus Verstraetearchaeota archaeon]